MLAHLDDSLHRSNLAAVEGKRIYREEGLRGRNGRKRMSRAMIGLYVGHFNYSRIHETLRTTPAVALGITDRVWSIDEPLDAALPR